MAQATVASNRVHFPGLNGLRFYAAVSVLVQHAEGLPVRFGMEKTSVLNHAFLPGTEAVNLFFVLSGFLITFLLLTERDRSGDINVRKFYLRRALRIWPLYFLIVFLAFAVIPMTGIIPDTLNIWNGRGFVGILLLYLLFLANVANKLQPVACASMLWSVGIEEQFYLMWPHVIKRTGRFLLWGLIALIVGKLLLHYGMDRLIRSRHTGWRTVTDVVWQFHLESLALGGVGACLVFFHHQRVLRWIYHPTTQIVFGAWFVGIVCWWSPFPRAPYAVHAAVYLVVIMNVACNPHRLLSLENRFLDFGGKLSYGIYMTHPIFMFASFALVRNFHHLGTGPIDPATVLVHDGLVFAGAMTTAWLSFRYFESPFLKLKERFTIVVSTATALDNAAAPEENPRRLAA